MQRLAIRASIMLCAGLATACGGGGGSSTVGNAEAGTSQAIQQRTACQDDFSPDRIDNGGQCAPSYFDYCPSTGGEGQFSYDEMTACNGVQVDYVSKDNVEKSFSDTLDYIVLRPENHEPAAVVVALHFRQLLRPPRTAAATFGVQMRQLALARGRNAMVILPAAPGGVWPQTKLSEVPADLRGGTEQLLSDVFGSQLLDNPIVEQLENLGVPIGTLEGLLAEDGTVDQLLDAIPTGNSVQDFMDYIELVHEDAVTRFGGGDLPLFITGLSNGGLYALRFACERPDSMGGIDAVMSVGASLGLVEADNCKGRPPIGTVQVHGVNDPIAPYNGGPIYPVRGGDPSPPFEVPLSGPSMSGAFLDIFGPNNNCGGGIRASTIPAGAAGRGEQAGDVVIERFAHCNNPDGRRSFMVTITEGGHSWPGYDAPEGKDQKRNALGNISYDFDASLYGFDLLRAAAGL